jgi:hypothetical protein
VFDDTRSRSLCADVNRFGGKRKKKRWKWSRQLASGSGALSCFPELGQTQGQASAELAGGAATAMAEGDGEDDYSELLRYSTLTPQRDGSSVGVDEEHTYVPGPRGPSPPVLAVTVSASDGASNSSSSGYERSGAGFSSSYDDFAAAATTASAAAAAAFGLSASRSNSAASSQSFYAYVEEPAADEARQRQQPPRRMPASAPQAGYASPSRGSERNEGSGAVCISSLAPFFIADRHELDASQLSAADDNMVQLEGLFDSLCASVKQRMLV